MKKTAICIQICLKTHFCSVLWVLPEIRVSYTYSDISQHLRKSIFSLKSCRKCAFLCQFFSTKKILTWYQEVRQFPAILDKIKYLDSLGNWCKNPINLVIIFISCRSKFHWKNNCKNFYFMNVQCSKNL